MIQRVIHLRSAAMALGAMARFEPATVILGRADARGPRLGSEEYLTYLASIDTALVDALGNNAWSS